MSDKDIESEIQAKGLTAPRVTPDRIESIIASEHISLLRRVITRQKKMICSSTRSRMLKRHQMHCTS